MEYIPDLQHKTLIIEDCGANLFSRNIETISISAPNLLSFKFRGEYPNAFSLKNLSQLVDAIVVNGEGKMVNENQSICLNRLLKNFDHARALTLCSWCLKVLPIAGNHLESSPLCNLKCLTLETSLPQYDLPGLACLLRRAPNLETLVLNLSQDEVYIEDDLSLNFQK